MRRIKLIFALGLVIPALIIFRNLFVYDSVVWGDAPYYYPEVFKQLLGGAFAWTNNGNNLGGINNVIWITPLMYLYGVLHIVFGLSNNLVLLILFYFPAIILAFFSSMYFANQLKLSTKVSFFTSLFYVFNTYFLLLIDGGQVGVALAYGIFPLSLVSLKKLYDNLSQKNFAWATISTSVLTLVDPRISAISFVTLFVWLFIDGLASGKNLSIRKTLTILSVGFISLLIVGYWVIPLFFLGTTSSLHALGDINLVSLLNTTLIYQPHWHQNIFGVVSKPPFYFVLIPLLVLGSLFVTNKKKLGKVKILYLVFLILAFLAKGGTPPFGDAYGWFLENFRLSLAFRDSTKFFMPLILFTGILIGITAESLNSKVFSLFIYIALLLLIFPAFRGNLNFVLSDRIHNLDYKVIADNIISQDGFARTAWFPDRHPAHFFSDNKPAIDAKNLVDKRPFASMNTGSFDRFNFIHNDQFTDWFGLLGIKYLVFSGDQRKVELSDESKILWEDLLDRTATASGLTKLDWKTETPVYEVADTKPRIFATNKLFAVVGGDDVYGVSEDLDLSKQGFVFFEDGRWDPDVLREIAPESLLIVFNKKDKKDLAMSFLQDNFIFTDEAVSNQWATRGEGDYLRYKYELLINEIDFKEFDYGGGITYSTLEGEKIAFDTQINQQGDYVLAIRYLTSGDGLLWELNGGSGEISTLESGFSWFTKEMTLPKGEHQLLIENKGGVQIINTVAIIPAQEWRVAQEDAEILTMRFEVVNAQDLGTQETGWNLVDYKNVSPVEYSINNLPANQWIVFTDSYHPLWRLKFENKTISEPLPFYSIINGFYVEQEKGQSGAKIYFAGQEKVRLGTYVSVVTVLSLAIAFVWFYAKRGGKK